jgi:hypothetical protein
MRSFPHNRARRVATLCSALMVSATAFAACDDSPTTPVTPMEYQAALIGREGHDEVEGIASVTARATSFDAEIEIANAEADAVYTWQVATGTCTQPGSRVGAADRYHDLEVAEDGTAAADAEVPIALSSSGSYIVRVLDESGDEPVTVACGALETEE